MKIVAFESLRNERKEIRGEGEGSEAQMPSSNEWKMFVFGLRSCVNPN